jgi:hypothetical protein
MTCKGATMDVGGWLRGLGLGQFEATFRESEIDFDVLPELTEPDLEKLGIPPESVHSGLAANECVYIPAWSLEEAP